MKTVIGQTGKLALALTLAGMWNNAPAQINLLTGTTVTQAQINAGSVIVWSPEYTAFSSGNFSNSGLNVTYDSFAFGNNSSAGNHSAAIGEGSYAGNNSFSFGYNSSALGNSVTLGGYGYAGGNSVAIGWYPYVRGNDSIAIGNMLGALGNYSIAMGYTSVATGNYSIAIGYHAYIWDDNSIAIGTSSFAKFNSLAIGTNSYAGENYSLVIGYNSYSYSDYAISIGNYTFAKSYGSVVIGCFNLNTDSDGDWQPTGELFAVGNGTSSTARSNALVMKKNANMRTGGSIESKGIMRCAPGGDINMGDFTAGRNPATLNNGLMYSDE